MRHEPKHATYTYHTELDGPARKPYTKYASFVIVCAHKRIIQECILRYTTKLCSLEHELRLSMSVRAPRQLQKTQNTNHATRKVFLYAKPAKQSVRICQAGHYGRRLEQCRVGIPPSRCDPPARHAELGETRALAARVGVDPRRPTP